VKEPLEQISAPLISDPEAATTQEPGKTALDDPAVPTQSLGGVDAAATNPWGDGARPEVAASIRGVVRLVGMQLGRALARSARLASRADDGRDRIY